MSFATMSRWAKRAYPRLCPEKKTTKKNNSGGKGLIKPNPNSTKPNQSKPNQTNHTKPNENVFTSILLPLPTQNK